MALREGKVSSVLDDAYFDALKRGVLYWTGSGWSRGRALIFSRPLDDGDEGIERPRVILAFPQPEDGLLADVRIGMRLGRS